VVDRGAALELKLRALEQPSVEEPVLVHIARRCDLHHMRCTARLAAATAMYDTDMQEATTRQAVVEPAADDKEHVA
jgi:hypothetical protein